MPSAKITLDSLPPAYARIIVALTRRSGLSREEIAQQAYVAASTLSGGGYLRHMKSLGLVHISGWRTNSTGAFSIPQYSAGPGKDYPRPRMTPEVRQAPGMQRLLESIERFGPLDYRQAAHFAGLSPNTVKNSGYLNALVAQGKIHVAAWRRSNRGPFRPLYESGGGRAVSPPPALSAAEKSRAHRCRLSVASNFDGLAAQIRQVNRSLQK